MSKELKDYLLEKKHHVFRKNYPEYENLGETYHALGLSPKERMTRRFELFAGLEEPVFLPEEKICFTRTVKKLPDCFTKEEWEKIRKEHFIHELGYLSNVSPDYEGIIRDGLLKQRKEADSFGQRDMDALLALTEKYRKEAIRLGKTEIAGILSRVPAYGARTFREALQAFRILHFGLWLEGNYHVTVGRFDQYMMPYLKADMENGLQTRESALELLEDFFLSFHKDSDLYPGVQQGDNGQSMVLGGMKEDGSDGFNLLSELCLEASRNLQIIDPKINLRVSKNTSLHIYELGTQLTKAGLGFPQYSNDDVVIEGLKRLGYEEKDARNYVVAACWEFIIPKVGADVANIGALSFPKVIDVCLHRDLPNCESFEEFLNCVDEEIRTRTDALCDSIRNLWFVPSPFMNLCMKGGIYEGGKYNNFGFHGTGIATAADSLAAIKEYIYEKKTVTPGELIQAVEKDFEGYDSLLEFLRYEAPKMGNDDDRADSMGVWLLHHFAKSLEGKKNCRGGIYRAGTGSAMYYLWHAAQIGASPDGRRKGEAFGTNFSPSLFAKINGPISVIKSFTKPKVSEAINGGPLTLEFADSVFRDADSIRKVAALVKAYIDMGGHQLQLNTVSLEKMKDAQLHPEKYGQLVVRIWGWSAYFVELDKEYQDHVMKRQEYQV